MTFLSANPRFLLFNDDAQTK